MWASRTAILPLLAEDLLQVIGCAGHADKMGVFQPAVVMHRIQPGDAVDLCLYPQRLAVLVRACDCLAQGAYAVGVPVNRDELHARRKPGLESRTVP
jgi:hypothetical protein